MARSAVSRTRNSPAAARREAAPSRVPAKPPATGATGKDDRRKQILKAAVKVFAEKGYHGCRIADVARSAEVAYGLVYHYFRNKEELLESVFAEQWAIQVEATGRRVVRTPYRERYPIDPNDIEQALRADTMRDIAAVFAVHTDTASGTTCDLKAVRAAIDDPEPDEA